MQGEQYSPGLADAYLGMAKSFWMDGKIIEAIRFWKAVGRIHPYAYLAPFLEM